MTHIKTQRELFRQVIKPHCDGVYDFLQLAQGGRENFLHDIELEFVGKQEEELTKYLKAKVEGLSGWEDFWNELKRDIIREEYIFWVEKNRNRPLDMGEMCDIENAIEWWANMNGYGYLYED